MQTLIIAIVSAKGGVGKTTTAINLAQCLHDLGRRVIVVDGNYTKPNVGLQLGMTKIDGHINHVLQGHKNIKETVFSHYTGLPVVPGSIIYEEACGSNTRKFKDIIDDLQGRYEVVIIDTAPTFGHEIYDVLDVATHAILLTKPELPSITDTLRSKRLCQDKHIELMGVVVTHTTEDEDQYTLQDLNTLFNLPIIGNIPYDKNVNKSHHEKQPLVFLFNRSPATFGYKRLAGNLIGEEYEPEQAVTPWEYVLKKVGLR